MTLQSVNSSVCVCVIESLGSTPAQLGPAVSLDLIQARSCAEQEHMVLKNSEVSFALCHFFTEGPETLGAPRKAVPSPSQRFVRPPRPRRRPPSEHGGKLSGNHLRSVTL